MIGWELEQPDSRATPQAVCEGNGWPHRMAPATQELSQCYTTPELGLLTKISSSQRSVNPQKSFSLGWCRIIFIAGEKIGKEIFCPKCQKTWLNNFVLRFIV